MAILLLTGLGLGSALPSTPGYVGIYQFVAVTVLGPMGIAKSQALAFILVVQAYGYIGTLLLGLPSRVDSAFEEGGCKGGSPGSPYISCLPGELKLAVWEWPGEFTDPSLFRPRHGIPRTMLGPRGAPVS